MDRIKKVIFTLIYIAIILFIITGIEIYLRTINYGLDNNLFIEKTILNEKYYVLNTKFINKYYPGALNLKTLDDRVFFKKNKDKKVIRIFLIGESTPEGFPFHPNLEFGKMLETTLNSLNIFEYVELINLSFSAMSSYYVYDVSKKLLKYEPDIIMIYSGHNEYYGTINNLFYNKHIGNRLYLFLKEYKIFQLIMNIVENTNKYKSDKALMEIAYSKNKVYNEKNDKIIAQNFIKNIQDTINIFKNKKIPVVVIEPISNIIDMPPFEGLNDEKYKDLILEYANIIKSNDINKISEYYNKIKNDIEMNKNANLIYLQGIAEIKLNNKDYINTLIKAKDNDIIPFRAKSILINSLKKLKDNKKNFNLYYLSIFDNLIKNNKYELFGNNFFIDHLHFNNFGHQYVSYLLSNLIINEIFKIDDNKITELINNIYSSIYYLNTKIHYTPINELLAYGRINSLLEDAPYKNMLIKYNLNFDRILANNDIFNDKDLYNQIKEKKLDFFKIYILLLNYYYEKNDKLNIVKYSNSFYNRYPGNFYTYIVLSEAFQLVDNSYDAIKTLSFAYGLSDKNIFVLRKIKEYFTKKNDEKGFEDFIKENGISKYDEIKINSPKKLMEKIYRLEQEKKYFEIYNYIYNITFSYEYKGEKRFFNSSEKIVNGIIDTPLVGDYSYHSESVKKHIDKYIGKYTIKGNKYLVNKYLIETKIAEKDQYINYLANNKPEDLLFYINARSVLIFVKYNKGLKLLYTRNMIYCEDYNKKNQQLDYEKK